MATVLIDRWLRITLQGFQFDQRFEHVLSYSYGGADPRPTETDLNNIAFAFWTAINTNYRALMPTISYVSDVFVEDRSPSNRVQGHYTVPSPNQGTAAGDCLPFSASETISFKTGEIYKGGHGRCYLPAGVEGFTLNGLYSSAYLVLVAAFAANLAAFHLAGSQSLQHVVARQQPGYLKNVKSYAFDYIPDSQRRRLQGRGR